MRRVGWTLVLVLGAAPLRAQVGAPSEAYRLRLELFRWNPTLTSQLQVGENQQEGTLLDLKSDLGFQDKSTYVFGATLKLTPGQKLRGSYTRLDYAGDTNASRSFVFSGSTYNVNTHVISSLKGGYYSLDYELDFVQNQTSYLGLTLGGKLITADASLSAPDQALSSATSSRVPVPVIGLTGRAYAGRFSVSGDASGLTIGKRGNLYELNGAVQFHFSDRLAVEGGYRLLHIKGESDLKFLSVQQSGWHFGGEISL
jgi:hypothetical protein